MWVLWRFGSTRICRSRKEKSGRRQRASAARSVLGNVGMSSSCGMGRHTPEQFEAATALIRELSEEATR